MNILLVCEGINESSIVAQPWKHVYELARRMIKYGHQVKILTNHEGKKSISKEEINDVPIHRIKKGKFLFDSDDLLKHLNDYQVDVINWHGSDVWSIIHLWRIRRKLKNNVVWTLHSGPLSIHDFKNLKFTELFTLHKFWNNILNALFPSWIVKEWINLPEIKQVITLSQRLKEYFIKNGIKNESKVKVIRSGVDIEKFNPLNQKMMTLENELFETNNNDDKIILYFGPLSTFRGVDTLLATIPKITKKIPSARLILLARGFLSTREERKLEKMAKNIKSVQVIKGILKYETLVSYLGLANVVVLPFKFWPQVECPLTLLEAMAMEKPVITTKVGAIPEIIVNNENGILVPPKKHEVLAEAIVELLNDKELALKIGENARKYVVRFHSWDVIVKETLETFTDALSHTDMDRL
jgi:glycosyltransferase involved in cell wall biosynthesis